MKHYPRTVGGAHPRSGTGLCCPSANHAQPSCATAPFPARLLSIASAKSPAMILRSERPADAGAIRALTKAAFAGAPHASGTEAAIVDALRRDGALALSLVAEEAQGIVAHLCFSPVRIGGRDCGWFGLGPVSVAPHRQGEGIGSRLIREGLSRLRNLPGTSGCVVLGDPGFYARFGFTPDPGLTFDGAPPEYFLQGTFSGSTPEGAVTYHPAFYQG